MTIGTDDVVLKSDAIVDLASSSGTVANDVFSVAGDEAQWTNSVEAPLMSLMLECTFATAPTTNTNVLLYFRKMSIDGSNHAQVPDDDFQETYITAFPLENINTIQRVMIGPLAVPNYKDDSVFELYIKNNGTGQTMSAGWRIEVTPHAHGAKPA